MQDVALPGSEHRSKGRRQPIAAAAKKEETRGGWQGGGRVLRGEPCLLSSLGALRFWHLNVGRLNSSVPMGCALCG